MIKSIKLTAKNFFLQGHERTLKAKKNIAASLILKGGSIIVGLFMVPITINYVNTAQYGIWLTLSSIIGWFSFFDIGLGNGLKNKLAETNAVGEELNARIYVSTTYAVLIFIAFTILTIFFCINPFISWRDILNTQYYLEEELKTIAIIVVLFFSIQFIIQIINTVLTANHAPAKSSTINFLSQLSCFIVIYILTKTTEGSLLYLVLVLTAIPLTIHLFSSIWFYKTSYSAFAPSIKLIKFRYAKELLKVGGVFFFIQIGAIILFQTDNIIIIQLFGPKAVTTFNVVFKLFSIIMMIFTIIMTPFWCAFTEAYAQNDIQWIKTIFIRLKRYWLYLVAFTFFLFSVSPIIFKIWLGNSVDVSLSISFTMSMYVIGNTWLMIHCFLLNGIGKIRLQLYLYIISTFTNIPIAILLGKSFGLIGIISSNVLIFIFMGILFSIQCKKILSNTAAGIWNK